MDLTPHMLTAQQAAEKVYAMSGVPFPKGRVFLVLWPCGNLGWCRISERMYREILAKPQTYSGATVAVIES